MPPWASDKRIEDVAPSFDVFSLGKVFWSMLSGKDLMRFWHFADEDYPQNDLTKLFPDRPEMQLANDLFAKCIVERERECLPDASA
jgi:hypothetical protein